MSYIDEQLKAGELRKSSVGRGMDMANIKDAMMRTNMGANENVQNLMNGFTGGGMSFNSGNTQTGFAPGESLKFGPGGVAIRGQNAGVMVNPEGGFDVDYSPSSNTKIGLRGQIPRAAAPGQAEAYFEIGGPRDDVMQTPAEQVVDNAVSGMIGMGNTQPGQQVNRSAAQDYLQKQLEGFNPINAREGIF